MAWKGGRSGYFPNSDAIERQTAGVINIEASSMKAQASRRKKHLNVWCAVVIFLVACVSLTFWRSRHASTRTAATDGESQSIHPDPEPSIRLRIEPTNFRPQQRRALTTLAMFKKNRCKKATTKIKIKEKAQLPVPQAYLATYPGSGSRITRQLIKALTGLRVQNAQDQLPKSNAVAVQTQYPHEAGNLPSWDGDIGHAIILIRNPIHSLPTLFSELYVNKKHLPSRFHPKEPVVVEDTATVAEWISWRDRVFDHQMRSFTEFIGYWIKRYGNNERLIVSYDDLMDSDTGSEEAVRLTEFLGQHVPTVTLDEAPCVWRRFYEEGADAIDSDGGDEENGATGEQRRVRGRRLQSIELKRRQPGTLEGGSDPGEGWSRRQLSGYFIPHPKSIHAAPSERPFTREQLKSLINLLHQISEELYTHSQHLQRVLVRYRDEIMDILKSLPGQGHDHEKSEGGTMQSGRPPIRPFHIFQVSPPGTDSPVVLNWLMGLLEPDADFTNLVTTPGLGVFQNGEQVPITTTIVTQTNEMNLIQMYKIFKPGFDEVFFVLAKSGTDADQQINEEICEYDNVLCIEPREQQFNNEAGLQSMVQHLTERFHHRFGTFFGSMENPVGGEQSAILRLKGMVSAINSMENEPYEAVDPKFGVHGGLRGENSNQESGSYQDGANFNAVNDPNLPPRRLFYCGSSGSAGNRKFSTLGIFLANAFFPEVVGGLPSEDAGTNEAIQLTLNSINEATSNDFLVHHMHQYCEVDVLTFPGLQLHINHPTHGFNAYGEYTPPGDNVFVIGAHEEGPYSIHLPYAMMKWWVLVKGLGSHGNIDQPTMEKFFVPSARPKNTGKHFLLYANSHYAEHREMAAFALSQLGPLHALGSCQGNINTLPIVDPSRPPRCQPFADDKRPPSIIVPNDMNRKSAFFTDRVAFQDFRFMLLMEDYKIPGYITERIVDGFMAGTIPIYYGTAEVFAIFNPKAFIYYDITKPQEALDRIRYLEENPEEYQKMLNEPILADGERTIERFFSFDDSIGNGMLKKKVRSKLGFPV